MPALLAMAMRPVAEAVRGDLTAVRNRPVRSRAILSVILVLATVASELGAAALATELGDWTGLVPALLSIAALSTITALILALTISTQAHRLKATAFGVLGLSGRKPPRVDPLIVVGVALAVGLPLGCRRGL